MDLAICSLSSGSSGNCYVISSNRGCLIIDAGISARKIKSGLASLGLAAQDLNAVLITHEHSDHIKGLGVLAKKDGADVYATAETLGSIQEFKDEGFICHPVETGGSFKVADMEVSCFAVSHDAAGPCGYSVSSGHSKICVVTDTGIVTEEIRRNMYGSDILVLESNHDENILRVGSYPWFLKQRILSEKGHLSNDSAARVLADVLSEEKQNGFSKPKQVLLAHLSKENNFPEMAMATMENILLSEGFDCGGKLRVSVLPRTEMSPVYSV